MKTLPVVSLVLSSWLLCSGAHAQDVSEDATLPGDDRGHLYAEIETSKGLIEAELDFIHSPLTTMNFVGLAEGTLPFEGRPKATGFYDGTTFHRVVRDFVIQGGDPLSADPAFPVDKLGDGGPGYRFPDEFNPRLRHDMAGVLSMANDGPDTNGSQFFITLREENRLNYLHSVFGQVVRGMDVVNRIEQGDKILHVTIKRSQPMLTAEAKFLKAGVGSSEEAAAAAAAQSGGAVGFHATPEAFEVLKKSVTAARHAVPADLVSLMDDTKQLPDARVKNFNSKLANYERATGHRIVVRLLPEFKPTPPEQSVGNAVKNVATALSLPDSGDNVLACYFAASDTWNLRLGEATYPALLGQAGTTDQLMASGALHQGKTALVKSAQDLTKAGKLKEGIDAVIDTLILRFDDHALKQTGSVPSP